MLEKNKICENESLGQVRDQKCMTKYKIIKFDIMVTFKMRNRGQV